jgi:hypothetical protein
MHGFTRARTLVGALLAGLLALGGGTTATAAAPPARGAKMDSAALARHIDKLIDQRLRADRIDPSPLADDAEFLRRVYLDLTGKIPPAERAAAFLDSKDPGKRARLIDELLASPDYGRHQADVWQALLLPRTSQAFRFRSFYPPVIRWLEESFNANKPWDGMVREVLTASGPVDRGPGFYYFANQSVDQLTDSFTKLFLGVQLQCAQCHNHPFTDWKRDDYWGMAAFFMKVRPNGRPQMVLRRGGTLQVSEGPRVFRNRQRLPDSARMVPAKFLGGQRPEVAADARLRPVLADWATSPSNPYFSRAMVNRTWAKLLGRGLVNPADDMHDANPPSHPELLADLAGQFAASGFDVKHLIRAICNSQTYQRTSKPAGNNADAGPEVFARMAIKVLTPGQHFDSLLVVYGPLPNNVPRGRRPGMGRFPFNPRDGFITFFNVEEGADPTEYQAGIPQVLRLMNARPFNRPAALNRILGEGPIDRNVVIEKLYLTTLARRPTAAERTRITAYLDKHKDRPRLAYADVLWALVNCSEFAVNR